MAGRNSIASSTVECHQGEYPRQLNVILSLDEGPACNRPGCGLGEDRLFDCQDILADPAVLGDLSIDFAGAVNHR